jgi:transposase-like protein
MAYLKIIHQDNQLFVISQDFCFTLNDSWPNRKVMFVILSRLCSSKTGKSLFTYQQLADEFGYKHRQNIQNYVQEFEKCSEDFKDYLMRRRKVDESVVAAVSDELSHALNASEVCLCERVSLRLGRVDLTPENIHAALEQVPCTVIRKQLRKQWEAGSFHPKEQVILEQALAVLVNSSSVEGTHVAEQMQALDILPAEREEENVVQQQQAQSVTVLLNPNALVSEVSWRVKRMVFALTLYFWNVPLSRIGLWFGISKGTVYQWVIGLAVALFPIIQAWIVLLVQAISVSVDEKWLKIKKHWHYWFVSLDEATGLPIHISLLPTRTKWACCWFLVCLKRLGKTPRAVITDGLKGYASSLQVVFPRAKHLLCIFHYQQGVTRWLREHAVALPKETVGALKQKMKKVTQTGDSRTVRRRLTRLESEETAEQIGLNTWISGIRQRLVQLIPALRHNPYPRTTNSIERFFRAFQRFYKTRGGFHSVMSAKRELMLFVVVYVFTIQVGTGRAPIEKIVPQAKHMPLYKLLNDPFRYGLANMCQAEKGEAGKMATCGVPIQLENA